MAEALEGLDSVIAVSVDLDDDRFDIRFVPTEVKAAELANVISELGYRPEVVRTPTAEVSAHQAPDTHFSVTDSELLRLVARAEDAGKPLLLDVYTPG